MLKNASGLSSLAIGSIYDLGDKFLIQVGYLNKENNDPFKLVLFIRKSLLAKKQNISIFEALIV